MADFSTFVMYRNLEFLHMADFSPQNSFVIFVTNIRYGQSVNTWKDMITILIQPQKSNFLQSLNSIAVSVFALNQNLYRIWAGLTSNLCWNKYFFVQILTNICCRSQISEGPIQKARSVKCSPRLGRCWFYPSILDRLGWASSVPFQAKRDWPRLSKV